LWARAFALAEEELRLPPGSIKCTVLIETILAAFEMDAILYELREHSCALNAGRWDYIFSCIKRCGALLPDRAQVTMTVPFMRAYSELLVRTCHARGAHAIGGMAAFIPSRRDPEVNRVALAKVSEDKQREAGTVSTARGWRIPISSRRRRRSSTRCWVGARTSSSGSATT
jgi:malate synthase